MPQRHRTPSALNGRVFSRAQALENGLTTNQLRRTHYDRLSKGIWAARDDDAVAPDARTQLERMMPALRETFPDHALSHQSAAVLWHMRLPPRLRYASPIHLTRIGQGPRVKRPGFVGHRATNSLVLLPTRSGPDVTGPARTVIDIAGLLSNTELIAVIDGVVCAHTTGRNKDRPPQRSLEDLHRDVASLHGTPGVGRVRSVLDRVRVGVDSEPETRLRLLLEDFGLGGFETDLELRGADGLRVHPDLGDRSTRLSLQYEGRHHDASDQRVRDIHRQRATASAGWTEVRITARDLDTWVSRRGRRMPRAVALVLQAMESSADRT